MAKRSFCFIPICLMFQNENYIHVLLAYLTIKLKAYKIESVYVLLIII